MSFRDVIETDVYGFLNIAQAGIPILRQGKVGWFVVLTTTATGHTLPCNALSATPKAAMAKMVRQLALEDAFYSTRANSVGPGAIKGGMELPMSDAASRESVEGAMQMTQMKRWVEAGELAGAVAFLGSSKASYVTSQVSMVDGAITA